MLRKRGWGREMGRRWKGIMVRKGEKKGRERERGGTWKGSRERGEDVALRPWWREEILRWVSESRGKASQTLWLITDMSSAGWHCKSIVKAFIRCLVEHRAVSPSPPLSPPPQVHASHSPREKAPFPPAAVYINQSRYGHSDTPWVW